MLGASEQNQRMMTIRVPSDLISGMRRRLIVAACVVAALLAVPGCRDSGADSNESSPVAPAAGQPAVRDPAEELRSAVEMRDWDRALQVAEDAMITHPGDADVLTNAAIATANSGQRVEAARLLVEAAEVEKFAPGIRVEHAFRALLDVGRLHDAIELLENVVERYPDATGFRRRLVGCLGEAQLTEQVDQHLSRLIRDRQFDLPLLLATTESSSRRYSANTVEALLKMNPDDSRPRLGHAKTAMASRDPERAEQILREIVDRHPDFAPAQAMLGTALVATGKLDEVPNWFSGLPPDTPDYSGYWTAVGDWSIANGQTSEAVRAFAEATRRSANETSIWARLAEALQKLLREQAELSAPERQRIDCDLEAIAAGIDRRRKDLFELQEKFARFRIGEFRSQTDAVEIAATLLDLGRVWEAEAWLAVAIQLPDDPSQALANLRQQAVRRLSADRDWQSRQGYPELAFDLKCFPLPEEVETGEMSPGGLPGTAAAGRSQRPPIAQPRPIRLVDEARQRKLDFYGRIGSGVRDPRVPIYQTLGCGGGVIDFDNDDRHDLVLVAAGGSIRGVDNQPGALFRNFGSHFQNISSRSQFADRGFGCGVAVGDYNDDGFQDVLVLNLGRNGLWRNNGDGTFTDASDLLSETGPGDWSTSGAMADVDGDGYSDLVIVNYCDADQPLDEPCFDADGREVNCYPLRYRASRDRFLAGGPDGRFRDVTDSWANQPSPGRGLGIVVGRLDGQAQGVYIVNDASINQFYRRDDGTESETTTDKLIDSGIASGLAVDAQSLDQGSMGIASGDLDNDGDLDFYVTGFNNEYNIYYDQRSSGFWADRTASLGMVAGTRNLVGFGTEAIDFDNDGVEELLVTNGHIGDFGPGSSPYAQPMQLFRASPDGRFRLVDMNAWGEYFSTPHVGRVLFTCDANQDGRMDVVVTHATEPVALLVNHSDPQYHRIAFRLVGTRQARDAVGATLQFEIRVGSKKQPRHLFRLSGHGYLCSNQAELVCGTGSASVVHDVRVTWPDGESQRLGDLDADAEYLIVRGETPFQLRRYGEGNK
mgnify:CR=1 FL=1